MRKYHHSQTLEFVETFCAKSSFVDSHITIIIRLLLEDPFILHGLPIIGQVNQSSHFVLIHGSHLRFHGHFVEFGLIIASS